MTQGEATRLESFEVLLDDFGRLPGRVARPPTFMEIAGYPNRENACSNILAFFMDSEEPHGLGTLVLDALASVTGIAAADEGVGGNISVEREVYTDAGKKIDILIQSDTHAIIIENKIYAKPDNPFADYASYLNQIADGRAKHKLLLTISQNEECREWGFTNLMHEEFVGQIRSLLGRYVSSADARYLTMFLDFLNTLDNLQEGSRMDQKFVKLLAERQDDIKDLLAQIRVFEGERKKKVQDLGTLIELSEHQNIQQRTLPKGRELSAVLFHEIPVSDDLQVGVDTVISPQGWEIQIFVRGGGNPSKLRELLQRLEIPFEEKKRFIHHDHFAYDANLDRITPVLQEVVDKLATSQNAGSDLGPA